MDDITQRPGNWVAALRGFLGTRRVVGERCELCDADIPHRHPHLIEPESRRLLCACPACALLFDHREAKRYRRVPREVIRLDGFRLSDAQWDAFLIPINLAFFFRSSTENRVLALYPGPAGATESTLKLAAWTRLAEANPVLEEMEDDVEALLVNRTESGCEVYRIPIDRCFELVGLIRSHWNGFSGGTGAREAIRSFFEQLHAETDHRGDEHA